MAPSTAAIFSALSVYVHDGPEIRRTPLFSPLQYKPAAGDNIVLSASEIGQVVRRASGIKIPYLCTQAEPSPELGVNASSEIERAAMNVAWRLVRRGVNPQKALFIHGPSTSHCDVR